MTATFAEVPRREAITSVHDVIVQAAAERPHQPAIIGEGRTVTYAELLEGSREMAAGLVRRGLSPGDRVGYLGASSVELVELIFGCSMARLTLVPFNWRLAPRELSGVIVDAEPALTVVQRDLLALFASARPTQEAVVVEPGDGLVALRGHAGDATVQVVVPDDPAWVIYTSGTTGQPKGVVLTQGNFVAKTDGIVEAWRFLPGRVVHVASPVFHLTGIGWVLNSLRGGGTVVQRRSFDVAGFIADAAEHAVTNSLMVPSVLNSVLSHPGVRPDDLAQLQTIVYGVAPISESLLARAVDFMPDCEFVHAYGLTEATGAVTWLPWNEHRPGHERNRSCGRRYPWVELRVVDPETGSDVAARTVGEVWTRSGNVMAGYFRRPDATAATITADGWLRTGDAGYLDEEGYLYLTDRLSDMIISGGENIYPAEVENVLGGHPAVHEVAVVGVPDERWGETVRAIVVLRPGCVATERELIDHARADLAHYKCPTSIGFAEHLPKNPTGKILRRQLRQLETRREGEVSCP